MDELHGNNFAYYESLVGWMSRHNLTYGLDVTNNLTYGLDLADKSTTDCSTNLYQ